MLYRVYLEVSGAENSENSNEFLLRESIFLQHECGAMGEPLVPLQSVLRNVQRSRAVLERLAVHK